MITRLTSTGVKGLSFTLFLFILLNTTEVSASPATLVKSDSTPFDFPARQSIFDHLQQAQLLKITIVTDLETLINDRKREEYQDGRILIAGSAGEIEERPIEIKPRGKYRRRVCDFPPVKISFKKANLQTDGLDPTFDDIKLVTHCLDNRGEGNNNVLREFLIYKLYGLLTDRTYRVQLAEVTYQDEAGKYGKVKRYAFLIEDTDQLAERLGGKECKACLNPDPQTLAEKNLGLLSVFQFMIGNADWNLRMLRNLKLIRVDEEQDDWLVPYDFDFAGLVNASYAIPNPDYALSSTRERIFLGPPLPDEALRFGIQTVKSHEGEMLAFVDSFDLLPRRHREDVRTYLEFFFDYLDQLEAEGDKNLYQKLQEKKLAYSPG